jgi:hypothetical protein
MIDTIHGYLSDSIFKRLLVFLFLLNMIDAFATLYWVTNGIADEANPIMYEWLNLGPMAFISVKLFLVGLGVSLLWAFREHALSKVAIIPGLLMYGTVTVMHCIIAYDSFILGTW